MTHLLISTFEDPKLNLLRAVLDLLPEIRENRYKLKIFVPFEAIESERNNLVLKNRKLVPLTIKWREQELQKMIHARLEACRENFTEVSSSVYSLAALSVEALEGVDSEISTLAERRPRWAIRLADMLIKEHCRCIPLPEKIQLETWDKVKEAWSAFREDLLKDEERISSRYNTPSADIRASQSPLLLNANSPY